jgi:ABC-2 type transport system ATP-binding protein
VRRLDTEKIELADISLRRPSLDDVFMSLTGHAAEQRAEEEEQGEDQDGGAKKRKKRKER